MLALALAALFVQFRSIPGALAAEESGGRVEWNELVAVGRAPFRNGRRETLMAARRNLLATLLRIPISADFDAAQRLAGDSRGAERLRVLAMTAPARVVVGEAGGVLETTLSLAGEVLDRLLPPTAKFGTNVPPRIAAATGNSPALERMARDYARLPVAENANAAASLAARVVSRAAAPFPAPPRVDVVHSGLVVDARGLPVTRALLPVIYDDEGVGIYGAFCVRRADVVRQGLVVYAWNLDDAALRARVGEAPLVVKAAGPALGGSGPDLRLAGAEAEAARKLLRFGTVAAHCAVAVLTD